MDALDSNKIKVGKGFLRNRDHVHFYITNGYKPDRILLHFKCTNDVLKLVLAYQAASNLN